MDCIKRRKEIEALLKDIRKEIAHYPEGKLLRIERDGFVRYIHAYYEEERYVRKGISKNVNLVRKLARKQYLLLMSEALENELRIIKDFVKEHAETSSEQILDRLNAAYIGLPEEFFLENSYGIRDALNVKEGAKDLVDWASKGYEKASYMEEEKKHKTTRGLKVRSKSEMLIAQVLYEYEDELAFRYEQIIRIGEHTLIPDFVIMTKSGKKYYWEHAGLISNPEYLRRHMQKLELYARAGITMWNNLIVTYDDENGNLDATIIEGLIKVIILRDE